MASPLPGGAGLPDAHVLTDVVTRLRRALRASIRTDYPWEALPMAQVELMQTLAERSPARINDLADRLHLAQSTVSGLIGQMITAGLVERAVDSADRRAAVVTLTEDGEQKLAGWLRAHERRIGAALAELGGADQTAIAAALPALDRLVGRLQPDEE